MVSISRGYLYYIWIACLFAILLLSGCSENQHTSTQKAPIAGGAEHGTLELSGWNFDTDGNVALNGEWEFYWNRLLGPEQVSGSGPDGQPPNYINLPHAWNGQQIGGESLSGNGYATFHLKVRIEPASRVLALELPAIRTAYNLWVNGQPLVTTGTIGTSRDASKPEYVPQLLFFPQSNESTLDIVLQVSNFHHRLGGIWQELKLGEAKQMTTHHNSHMGLDMLLVGGLLLMGLYHIGLYLIRLKERSSLYFALFCLFVGVRTMLVGEGTMYQLFPGMDWVTGLRIEYSCFFLGLPTVLLFCKSLYPQEFADRGVQWVRLIGVVFFIAAMLLPPWIFTWMTGPFQAVAVVVSGYAIISISKAFARKREGALFALIGIGVYSITVVIDIAYYNQWIRFGDISSLGLFFLVIMTSFIISLKSFRAFASLETLSRQFRELNLGLEYRIRERTAELEQSNKSLEKINEDLARMETSRRHLLSNISHDLGTPMTLIQGYVEALIDRVVVEPEQQDKYLRLILSRITGLNRLIADLFQLSKLEARQIDFSMQDQTVEEFTQYFSERYDVEVKNAGLRFSIQAHIPPPAEEAMGVMEIDIDRIDQVLTNIIYNAIKHTPSGGSIQLQLQLDGLSLVIKVQDNGIGIDPENLPYIFDRFYKKDKSRNSASGGSGLGLAIAKEIVEFHGGWIWAESQLGFGTNISFSLPLKRE